MADITYTHPALEALEGRLTVTVNEAAAILGLGRSAAYEATRRGQIPSRRIRPECKENQQQKSLLPFSQGSPVA